MQELEKNTLLSFTNWSICIHNSEFTEWSQSEKY